jgi:hypothetical protein
MSRFGARSPAWMWPRSPTPSLSCPTWAGQVVAWKDVLADRVNFDDMASAVEMLSGRFDVTLVDIADAVVELADVLVPPFRRPCDRGSVMAV